MKSVSKFTKILLVLTATVAFGFLAQIASATSGAHFFSATGSVADNGALVVTFDESGVGQETVDLSLTATGNATYACINGGGNHPKAANKESVTGPVSGSGSFAPTKNGRVSGSLSAGPPASNLTCPSGQTFVLACVTYTNIVLTDTTNDVSTPVADVSRTFFNIGAPC
jgi:DNA-binding phage protein